VLAGALASIGLPLAAGLALHMGQPQRALMALILGVLLPVVAAGLAVWAARPAPEPVFGLQPAGLDSQAAVEVSGLDACANLTSGGTCGQLRRRGAPSGRCPRCGQAYLPSKRGFLLVDVVGQDRLRLESVPRALRVGELAQRLAAHHAPSVYHARHREIAVLEHGGRILKAGSLVGQSLPLAARVRLLMLDRRRP